METTPTAEVLLALVRELAPEPCLSLRSTDLCSKYGFSDGDLLCPIYEGLEVRGLDRATLPDPDAVLAQMVHAKILLPLADRGVVITASQWHSAHNPIRSSRVNGLSENEDSIPYLQVAVSTDDLVAAFAAAQSGGWPPFLESQTSSAVESGLSALVGRRVWVTVAGGDLNEPLGGVLIGMSTEHLSMRRSYDGAGELVVVPMDKVLWVTTGQLVKEESGLYAEPDDF